MYRRVALVLLAATVLVSVLAVGAAFAAAKPFTATHQDTSAGTNLTCSGCHSRGTGYDAHATHQRTMWLGTLGNQCGKCHQEVSTGYEGDLSVVQTTDRNLRRTVSSLVCTSCHGRFKGSSAIHTSSSVTVASNCTLACHKPNGTGSADSATVAHTGVTWINPTYINNTTIKNICLLCHGADGTTGLNNRAWFQTEDSTWTLGL